MAILTVAEFKLAFDKQRVEDLASDYNDLQQESVYDETILTAIIAQAEDYVKAQLSKMYSTVQIEADSAVERVTADVAMYYLELRRNQISPDIQVAFDRALKFLENIQNGTFKLAAVQQLLPSGNTDEPTEVLRAGEGLLYLTKDESSLLT